jgi:hypothetical protein
MSNDLNLGDRYEKMHELSRHIIHMSETFDVTVQTIEQIFRFHQRWSRPITPDSSSPDIAGGESPPYRDAYRKPEAELEEALLFHQLFFNNLKMRANAFEERLHNEIQLVSHSMNLPGWLCVPERHMLTDIDRHSIGLRLKTATPSKVF